MQKCAFKSDCGRDGQFHWMRLVPESGLYERTAVCEVHNAELLKESTSSSWLRILPPGEPASTSRPAAEPQTLPSQERSSVDEEESRTESEASSSGEDSFKEDEEEYSGEKKSKSKAGSKRKKSTLSRGPPKQRSLLLPRSNTSSYKRSRTGRVPRHANLDRIMEKCDALSPADQASLLACLTTPEGFNPERPPTLAEVVHAHIENDNQDLKEQGWALKQNFPRLGRAHMAQIVAKWWKADLIPSHLKAEGQRISELSAHYLAAMECKRASKRRKDAGLRVPVPPGRNKGHLDEYVESVRNSTTSKLSFELRSRNSEGRANKKRRSSVYLEDESHEGDGDDWSSDYYSKPYKTQAASRSARAAARAGIAIAMKPPAAAAAVAKPQKAEHADQAPPPPSGNAESEGAQRGKLEDIATVAGFQFSLAT